MSFRRDAKKANDWRKELDQFPELLQRAGLPDAVLRDRGAWQFFLQEGCFVCDESGLIDVMSFLPEPQLAALHELLSKILTDEERNGSDALWRLLDSRFRHK